MSVNSDYSYVLQQENPKHAVIFLLELNQEIIQSLKSRRVSTMLYLWFHIERGVLHTESQTQAVQLVIVYHRFSDQYRKFAVTKWSSIKLDPKNPDTRNALYHYCITMTSYVDQVDHSWYTPWRPLFRVYYEVIVRKEKKL